MSPSFELISLSALGSHHLIRVPEKITARFRHGNWTPNYFLVSDWPGGSLLPNPESSPPIAVGAAAHS